MFSTKYRIESVEELTTSNPMHEQIRGKICYPAYFAVGERGMMLVDMEDAPSFWNIHRIFTTKVQKVTNTRDGGFAVTTKNSIYVFLPVMEE